MKKCVVEGIEDPIDDCVFDDCYKGLIDDCCVATMLKARGKGRDDCEYWRDIPM